MTRGESSRRRGLRLRTTSCLPVREIGRQLASHAPFTALGTLSGVAIMLAMALLRVPSSVSEPAFWILHPSHVLASAYVTAAMYRRAGHGSIVTLLLIGWAGSVGISTLSDSVIPFLGEVFLALPSRHIHIGFIEMWWLVNPLAIGGAALALFSKATRVPHSVHVLLSTWASLFHMTMAMWRTPRITDFLAVAAFLFLAVWLPCCTSDIVVPLLFHRREAKGPRGSN